MATHFILDGKIHVYQRNNTTKWHCAARVNGKNVRKGPGEIELTRAKKAAEDWYFNLRGGGLMQSASVTSTKTLIACILVLQKNW